MIYDSFSVSKTMEKDKVKIVKVGGDEPAPIRPVVGMGRKKSMRTYPRGVLKGGKTLKAKIEGVRDPAKSPPVRKSTLKILTEKGAEVRRKRIRKTVRTMPEDKVRNTLRASGLPVSKQTPINIARDILEGGMEAGMIVVK
jgi:hypothetical protein